MKKTRWWQHVPVLLRSSREPECSSDHSSAGWGFQPYKAQVVANSETGSSPVIGRYRGEKEEKEDIIIIIIFDKAPNGLLILACIIFYYNEGG